MVWKLTKMQFKQVLAKLLCEVNMSKNFDTFMAIFLIILGIFILGVQIGIAHGRELQRQEYYEYTITD